MAAAVPSLAMNDPRSHGSATRWRRLNLTAMLVNVYAEDDSVASIRPLTSDQIKRSRSPKYAIWKGMPSADLQSCKLTAGEADTRPMIDFKSFQLGVRPVTTRLQCHAGRTVVSHAERDRRVGVIPVRCQRNPGQGGRDGRRV